ncbi:MAG: hypothetical protein LBM77_02715 [Spirochaetaceae bacterium]|jgi:hypothetical protein|nr:hypothetical protein [Spirochaetaceae bacterium]
MTVKIQVRKIALILLIALIGALANSLLSRFIQKVLGLSLYLDTVFTIATTFSGGLISGILCGFVTNLFNLISAGYNWWEYLFALCNAASALIVWVFMGFYPAELGGLRFYSPRRESRRPMGVIIILLILSFTLCVLISIMGGAISALVESTNPEVTFSSPSAETWFKLSLLREGIPLLAVEIIARLPVNIVDRIISVFAAYGIASLIKRFKNTYFLYNHE